MGSVLFGANGIQLKNIDPIYYNPHALVDAGNSMVVIEHNLDVIKCADHIIDMGPEGGDAGGYVIAEGTPQEIAATKKSYTGQLLKRMLKS